MKHVVRENACLSNFIYTDLYKTVLWKRIPDPSASQSWASLSLNKAYSLEFLTYDLTPKKWKRILKRICFVNVESLGLCVYVNESSFKRSQGIVMIQM